MYPSQVHGYSVECIRPMYAAVLSLRWSCGTVMVLSAVRGEMDGRRDGWLDG